MATTKAKMKQFQQLQRWKKAALGKANEVRVGLGYPPVDHIYKGRRSKSWACPITNTIYDEDIDRSSLDVDTFDDIDSGIEVRDRNTGEHRRFRHDMQSLAFVNHFDKGEYPELVEFDDE